MPEEEQFHITLVTQKRRYEKGPHSSHHGETQQRAGETHGADSHRQERAQAEPEPAPPKAAEPAREEQAGSVHAEGAGAHGHSSHHRRYQDYGTVNLGSLDGAHTDAADAAADSDDLALSRGELQKQFYNKYDTVLNRRYFTRNRNKVTRFIVIGLLAALIVIISLLAFNSLTQSPEETLEQPGYSTNAVETLDLG